MSVARSVSELPYEQWDSCRRCHDQCVSACPMVKATGDTRFYPSRLAQYGMELVATDSGANLSAAAEVFYGGCILCGLCGAQCIYRDDPKNAYDIVLAMRQRLAGSSVEALYLEARERLLPGSEADAAYDALLGELSDVTVLEVGEGPVPQAGSGDVLVLIDPFSAAWMPAGVAALVKLLQRAGFRVFTTARPSEAGGLMWLEGLEAHAERQMQAVLALVQSAGWGAVVTTLPTDAWYWSRRERPGGKRLLTGVEAIYQAFPGRSEAAGGGQRAVVQDSSVASRLMGQRELVVSLVAQRAEVVKEASLVGEQRTAQPMAYEGIPLMISEDLQQTIAENRLRQIRHLAADCVVTMDPFTHRALALCSWPLGVPVMTLYELLAGPLV